MQRPLTMRRNIYFFAWVLLLVVFFVRTTPRLLKDLHHRKLKTSSSTSSLDCSLRDVLGVSELSAELSRTFAQLPPDCRVIFVCPKASHDNLDFVCYAIAYLTWPRKIEKVKLGPNESFAGGASEHTAVVFCKLPAPAGPGPRLTLARDLVLLGPLAPK
jgi:hypothetical protein